MKCKKVLFEKLKRKFEMNIGIYYIRLLKDKMVYKVCNGIEIKIKGYGFFIFIFIFFMCCFKLLLFLYLMFWIIIV